ncbi:MAG: hypothetical protein Tsb0020_49400 [Haliangiales bacterium]
MWVGRRLALVDVLIVVSLIALVAGACGSRQAAEQRERLYLKALTPAQLKPQRVLHKEATRKARVRVFATRQYQAQNLRWRQRFADRIDVVNQYLIPSVGVELVVVDEKPWPDVDDAGEVRDMLVALERLDPGDDVDWVIGLASALTSTSSAFVRLGIARPLGKHVILRGFADLEAEPYLAELDASERERVRTQRRVHRETVMFLHEWAHTLGVVHIDATDGLMGLGYSDKVTGFLPQTESLLREVLSARLDARGGSEQAMLAQARVIERMLGESDWPAWIAEERAAQLERAKLVLAHAQASGASGAGGAGAGQAADGSGGAGDQFNTLPPEAEAAFRRAQGLARDGSYDAALAELDGLIAAYPAHTVFHLSACHLMLERDGPGESAASACGRVAAVDPNQLDGDFMLATALIKADERARAGEVMAAVRARVAAMGAGAGPAWERLISFYQGINAVTWAEQAIAAAPAEVDTAAVAAWAQELRRRYGLAPDSARRHRIAPADEGAYLQTVRSIIEAVYSGEYAAAQRQARAALSRYQGAPGVHGALCDLELRRKRYGPARQHCQQAVRGYGEATWARYLLGILELRARRNAAGIGHLERAIELDPALRQAYHALSKAYGRVRAEDKQRALDAAYQARFGVAMPP